MTATKVRRKKHLSQKEKQVDQTISGATRGHIQTEVASLWTGKRADSETNLTSVIHRDYKQDSTHKVYIHHRGYDEKGTVLAYWFIFNVWLLFHKENERVLIFI